MKTLDKVFAVINIMFSLSMGLYFLGWIGVKHMPEASNVIIGFALFFATAASAKEAFETYAREAP